MTFSREIHRTPNGPISIRKGGSADLVVVRELVRELAHFEKAPEEVTVTLEEYYQDFEKDWFELILAEHENQVVGLAFYYKSYSTWKGRMVYLEDMIVRKEWRNRGIGQLLFDRFLLEAKKMGARLTKWQVLDWNTGAIRFYERNNATIEREWLNGKIFFEKEG